VIEHVRALAERIGPRPGGSEQARAAAAYIESALASAGARPERHAVGVVDVPAIRVGPRVMRLARRVESADVNIVARFGPQQPGALVLLAHYDTVAHAPGAVDNAAAVGLLLELARVLAVHPPPAPVWLAFTADEEVGLVGARRLAAELGDQIAFAIAVDLVGVDGELIVNGASELIRGGELRWLAGAADAAGIDLAAPWPHRIISRWWPQIERADHGAFTARGIRAVHLMHRGGPGGERIYLAYHTPRDRIDQLSPRALAGAARLVRALANRPPPPPDTGDLGVWLPVPGNHVVPRGAWLLACATLIAIAVLGLARARRRLAPGPGLFAALAVWLVAAAIGFAIEHLLAGTHPAPWVHAPLRHSLAAGLVLVGAATLAAIAIARWRPWGGSDRYALAAAGGNLALGIALLAIGAAELAWLGLIPAALLAWAPRGRVLGVIAAVLAIVPGLALLSPGLLRELYFHGFMPTNMITAWLAATGLTTALVAAHLASRVRGWGPGATFAIPAAAVASIVAGIAVTALDRPACTADQLALRSLTCELDR
jgi:hypothetical protein